MPLETLVCDGCGQPADQEHIARRLQRLENMTRYRPIHVQALFLGPSSPASEADYLYSAQSEFHGEGLALLRALGIAPAGKPVEAVLADFQRRGYLLTHVLECPSPSEGLHSIRGLPEPRLSAAAVRVRRSLKPKKLVLFGEQLHLYIESLAMALPGVEMVLPASGGSFRLDELAPGALLSALSGAVAAPL
jgi:hypothetical protein